MQPSEKADTEEVLTCLHIQLYHPQQTSKRLYQLIPLSQRWKHAAEDPLRLGRDNEVCTFVLLDPRVSRKQLAIQAFRSDCSSELLFQVQNLSQRGHMLVNGKELGYLHWVELPTKALLRFGEYQLMICQDPGEAQNSFEVVFSVSRGPPCQESGEGVQCRVPVMDTGVLPSLCQSPSPQTPLEMDEEMYLS